MKARRWFAFVGPTLAAAEVRKFGCELLAPARQGDVWRALVERPAALVLIDGVFEAQPSVWHHELRAALGSGVAVFGAASMGALRAAELWREGMIGVGEIFRAFRDGERIDDADVAVLHAEAEHGFRALSVPQVNVDHALSLARRAKVVSPAAARRIGSASRALPYGDRSWPRLLGRDPAMREFLARTDTDLKAADARAGLTAAAEWIASGAAALPVHVPLASSHVRRRRLVDAVPGALQRAEGSDDAEALADLGTRRRLLAGWARAIGLRPQGVEGWLQTLPKAGLSVDEAQRLAEDLALEAQMLRTPERWLADGATRLEGLADQAMVLGRWKG